MKEMLREHRGLLLFILLMGFFRSAIADWNVVPTGSMRPTIVEGDRILVNRLAYEVHIPFTSISLWHRANPARGDIVVFNSAAADMRMVKRVIGLPGDRITMRDNRLYINGQQLVHNSGRRTCSAGQSGTYLYYKERLGSKAHCLQTDTLSSAYASFGPVAVPDGHYLVLGDNRDHSADSRVYGFIPRDEIVGRAGHVVMSLDPDSYYMPRADRFFQSLK